MPDSLSSPSLSIIGSLDEIDPAVWDACAGADNPFVSHAFLSALEDSGSATAATGWRPQHLVAGGADGRIAGVCPLYLKSHSWGEYVFDQSWAQALNDAGGRYYPKLLCGVPFTPVVGPRLLTRDDSVRALLMRGLAGFGRECQVSSVHVTFPAPTDAADLRHAGWLQRLDYQYHWPNQGYASFEDFLGALNARKRKAVRKERREVTDAGITLHTLQGDDIRPAHWDAFFTFYRNTTDRKWGQAYLTRAFFPLLGQRLGEKIVLFLARAGGEWVAGALNLLGTDALYGRNWGSLERYRFLHFETCYYQAIDFAINHGLARVEAGAQGQHKLQRGYLPVPTPSAHLIFHRPLSRAVAAYLTREMPLVAAEMADLNAASPYAQPR